MSGAKHLCKACKSLVTPEAKISLWSIGTPRVMRIGYQDSWGCENCGREIEMKVNLRIAIGRLPEGDL